MNLIDAIPVEVWLCVGFILSGAIIGVSIGYALGRRDAYRSIEPVYEHINQVHRSLGHKSYIILSPKIGANQRASLNGRRN